MQSTTEVTRPAVDFYSQITKDPILLANGYAIIKQHLLGSPHNRKDTLLNLLHPSVPIFSLVLNVYPLEIFNSTQIELEEKDSTVDFLLKLIIGQLLKPAEQYREKQVDLLFQFMRKIHNTMGYQRWVSLYLQALSQLANNNSPRFGYFLINTLKTADDRVSILTLQLLPHLINFQFSKQSQKLEIYYYILKSLAIKVDTDPQALQQHVTPFLSTIQQYALNNMNVSVDCLKFSLKLLTLMFGDYQLPCTPQILKLLETTSDYLVRQYIHYLNNSQAHIDDFQEEQAPIYVALYQMMELTSILLSNEVKVHIEKSLYFCVVCTLLNSGQYKNYMAFSDQFLMDIEDEGEVSIRNKANFLMMEFIQHQKHHKKSKQFMRQYITIVLGNTQNISTNMQNFLSQHQLPQEMLNIRQIYTQSALFMTTAFITDLFQGKTGDLSTILGNMIKQNPSQSIDSIEALLILSKCLKTENASTKTYYLNFLREMAGKFSQNIGMLIAIARGIFQYSPHEQLTISNEKGKGVPTVLVTNLSQYLLRDDSAQDQSAYLILQFWVHLLKCPDNRSILQQIVPFQKEVYYLKQYLDKGMSSVVMMEFTEKLANPLTLSALYKEIQNGYGKDENLSGIISQCVRNGAVKLEEGQILTLCKKYEHKIELVANIVAAFLETERLQNEELTRFLSQRGRQEWLPGLLKQGKLDNSEEKLLQQVNNITNQIESPQELENALLLPYFSILNSPDAAISILSTHSVLVPFFQKLYRYAGLFKGTHLKIITSHVFISLAEKMPDLGPKVIELIREYGKIESNDWEDEEMELDGDFGQGVLDKLFNKMVNDSVEEVFKNTFGELAWDSKKLYERLGALESRK